MKLSYDEIISPFPLKLVGVGNVRSPKLSDIWKITISTYTYYILVISSDEDFISSLTENGFDLSNGYYNLLINDYNLSIMLEKILDFFVVEKVKFSKNDKKFYTYDNSNKVIGEINNSNFDELCDLICQLNNVDKDKFDESKIKNKKALEIYRKIQNRKKSSKPSRDLTISNIVSAVSAKHPSLNFINIWDLTINQLWDTFNRLMNNVVYDITAKSVATWGDKDDKFDISSWYKYYCDN